jgi:hypothetical protein
MKFSIRDLLPRRRWFQFSLRTLMTAPLFVALGWWWVTWPTRTAEQFCRTILHKRDKDVEAFLSVPINDPRSAVNFEIDRFRLALKTGYYPKPRTVADFVFGRQSFGFHVEKPYDEVFEFTVERGRVTRPNGFISIDE